MLRTVLFACALTGCVSPVNEDIGSTEEAINSNYLAREWMFQRAVDPRFQCSATLIADRYVLTALHCTPYNDETTGLRFYLSATDLTRGHGIAAVHIPLGTRAVPEDDYDSLGRRADIAILELDNPAPTTSEVATLAWEYPGAYAPIVVVGGGNHWDSPEDTGDELRFVTSELRSDDDTDGEILAFGDLTNGGDSGGPLYYDRRLLGVTNNSGHVSTLFTSARTHLPWILEKIEYAWPYSASMPGLARTGTMLESFAATAERVCQYACEHMSACSAYNYGASTCTLLTGPTSVVVRPGYRSAVKN